MSVALDPAFRHPLDSGQRGAILSRYRACFPEAVGSELAEAERLLAHEFRLLGQVMAYGERIAWSRDPVSGLDWDSGFSADIQYRGPQRLGDIKLPWELSKHQYFFTLGKAAWLTDRPEPALEIVQQIDDWIRANPFQQGIHWISALETGMRAISWILAYPFFADLTDASFRRRMAESLAHHLWFVERNLSLGRFTNTHLTGEAVALVVGGLFLACRASRRWLAKGLAILEEEIVRQVAPDGVHREQSVAYHRFFLDHYYLAQALLAANGRSLPRDLLQVMERMTELLMDVSYPDGSAAGFGDADDARGIWCRSDCPGDFRSLLAMGAVLFERGDFKAVSGGLAEEVLWLMGSRGVERFESLPSAWPEHTSIAYPAGGYAVMRGGWGESDPVLVLDAGPLGQGSAGHGHADALSFELHAAGYRFLVDPGTYSYNLDYAWRDVFRSTRAHNTLVVDGESQSQPGDRMAWESLAEARCHRWLTTPWLDVFDGEHDGYQRLAEGVSHRRVIVFLKPDTWWVWDQLDGGASRHQYEALLHLGPDCRVEVSPSDAAVILSSPEGARLHLWIPAGPSDAGPLRVLAGDDEERAAWHSPAYGVKVPTRALSLRRDFSGRATQSLCLSSSDLVAPVMVGGDEALHVRLRKEGDGHEEVELYYRADSDRRLDTPEIGFDGLLLYRVGRSDAEPLVWASGFRHLSIPGLLTIDSPVDVESIALEKGCCRLSIAHEHALELRIKVREGVRVVVNGLDRRSGRLSSLSA